MALLAACGSKGGASSSASAGVELVSLYDPNRVLVAGRPQRIPFGIVANGALGLAAGAELPVKLRSGSTVIDNLTVQSRLVDHDAVESGADPSQSLASLNLLRYFALRADLPTPGIYDLEVDFGNGITASLPVQAFDPKEVTVPLPGSPLPHVDTPTTAHPEGINPLCTRAPQPCGLHDHSVAEVLDAHRPLALLVATPALCQTAYCGPVLETLVAESANFPAVVPIHLEVYANAADVEGNYADPRLQQAQAVTDLGLAFEPSLFLVNSDGLIVDRIDNVFNADELRAGLATLS